jgi:hypothetical protein
VIDKLEVTVERDVRFTRDLKSEYQAIRRKAVSRYYKERIDLRQVGIDAVLYRYCRFNGTHKVSVLQSARMSPPQMAAVIGQIFEHDPWLLRIARIDLAVDVPHVPVEWFRMHMYVPRKRQIKVIGVKDETTYFGSGADQIRLYDKQAELRNKRQRADIEGLVLTRIERQLRSGRIPREFTTLRDVMNNAVTFNPLASIILLPGGEPQPKVDDYRLRCYLEGTGLRQIIRENGLAIAWNILSKRSKGNAGRKIRQLSDFIPPDPEDFRVPDLFALYQKSVSSQLLRHKRENRELSIAPKFGVL